MWKPSNINKLLQDNKQNWNSCLCSRGFSSSFSSLLPSSAWILTQSLHACFPTWKTRTFNKRTAKVPSTSVLPRVWWRDQLCEADILQFSATHSQGCFMSMWPVQSHRIPHLEDHMFDLTLCCHYVEILSFSTKVFLFPFSTEPHKVQWINSDNSLPDKKWNYFLWHC